MLRRFLFAAVLSAACGPVSSGPAPSFELSVQKAGDGSGSVSAPGLSCPTSTCSGTYAQGTVVELTAEPDSNSYLDHWEGACTGVSCNVTMRANTAAAAVFMLKEEPVTVALRLDGGGTASVTSDPPGLACSATSCSGVFAARSTVTLTPANGSARFVRWTGACAVTGSSCQITITGPASVGAVFLGANYVFTTSTTVVASPLSLSSADAECNARAAIGGLPGTYVAWLSTSSVSAASRLGSARGWVRHDGRPFADSVASLTSGAIFYPIAYDENGSQVPRPDIVTGTNPDGTVASGENCADWSTTANSASLLLGRATAGTRGWTAFAGTVCAPGPALHLDCFGIDASTPVAPSPPAGRIAFVSKTALSGGGGLAAMDRVCAAEASAAGLTGTFKALAATSGATAASRFDLSGAPWDRVDGVAVTAAAADLATGQILAPIDVAADGSYSNALFAWTGADAPNAPGVTANTCADWNDGTAAASGTSGAPDATLEAIDRYESMPTSFFKGFTTTCDKLHNVYCLQQ